MIVSDIYPVGARLAREDTSTATQDSDVKKGRPSTVAPFFALLSRPE
ncbi:hypothetical protein SAMN04489801_5538 [Pseudomonas mandelii]|uniref:Uncharacterized protein n=1 Tax=Pseudomonas mandelii TaxID=75612 RepID=A0ABY0VZ93_9PSED|nr:hypothetical protein SAMN04489801_5538 [Pseudomonas mandelii]